jgi:hypothetical protein
MCGVLIRNCLIVLAEAERAKFRQLKFSYKHCSLFSQKHELAVVLLSLFQVYRRRLCLQADGGGVSLSMWRESWNWIVGRYGLRSMEMAKRRRTETNLNSSADDRSKTAWGGAPIGHYLLLLLHHPTLCLLVPRQRRPRIYEASRSCHQFPTTTTPTGCMQGTSAHPDLNSWMRRQTRQIRLRACTTILIKEFFKISLRVKRKKSRDGLYMKNRPLHDFLYISSLNCINILGAQDYMIQFVNRLFYMGKPSKGLYVVHDLNQ